MQNHSTAATALALFLAASLPLALAGCRGHTNYPSIPSARLANDNPNEKSPDEVIPEALRWIIAKYDPPMKDRAFAINAPAGLRRAYYERIARNTAPQAQPLTPELWEAKSMPIFHVARVWVREREAKVDVLRPRSDMTTVAGETLYQPITVTLRAEPFRPWRAEYGRSWEAGTIPMPEPYFIPATDNPEQFRVWLREQQPQPEPVLAPEANAQPTTEASVPAPTDNAPSEPPVETPVVPETPSETTPR